MRLLLEAEAALGQREALIDRYETFCHRLDNMLGLEPERETRRLYRRLLAADRSFVALLTYNGGMAVREPQARD